MATEEDRAHYYQSVAHPQDNEAKLSKEKSKVLNPEIPVGPGVIPGSRGQIPSEILPIEADEMLLWLGRYPVERNHPRSLTGTISVVRSGEVMVISLQEKLSEAFAKLVVEGFSCAPVIDSNRKYVGFIDLLDLTWFTVRSFSSWRETEKLTDEDETSAHWSRFMTMDAFKNATVANVMARPAWERRTIFNPAYRGFSTLYPMEFMARTGAHRIPILNKYHKVVNILTQSMLISLFDQNLSRFGSIREGKVRGIIPGLVQELLVIEETDLALNAFKKMVDKNISGLAVVDSRGVLVDTISIRDLRGIGTSANKYERLWLTISAFKERVREDFKLQTPAKPICVTSDSTFADVIQGMDDGNIHRVFVVEYTSNGDPLPTHVISQRDVLRHVLFKIGLEPTTVQEAE